MFPPLVPISALRAPFALVRRGLPLAVAACFAMPAHANPGGASVAAGHATFTVNGQTLTVTNTPGTIINWQQFSIRPDEITRFVQSGAASAVLNRVTGAESSQLLGQLLSNGRVFLINPNGVTIGAGAMIDTAGFIASSLNISDADFLSGRMKFASAGNAGKVENFGTIRASGGPVYLIAPTVENNGVIRADNGDILLAAGKRVEVVAGASPYLRVEIDNPEGAEALNVGELVGRSVSLYGTALRNAGTIQATQAEVGAGGNVILRAARDATLAAGSRVVASGVQGGTVSIEAGGTLLVDGTVDARGTAGKGGDVQLLGERVGLLQARVDASGEAGGGTVLVGGDYQGANPGVRNASRTYVDAAASIHADAIGSGDGGRVIVWADDTTHFAGTLTARGGAQGGDGGFAEISGKNTLVQRGRVDLTAAQGVTGTLLLDPLDIQIRGGTADGSDTPDVSATAVNQSALGQVLFAATGTADPFIVYESELENTAANIVLQARNSITVSNAVAFGGNTVLLGNNRSLTLQTRNQAGDGAGGIDLTAGGTLTNLLFRTQGTGAITIQSGVGPGAVAAPVTLGALQTANRAVTVSATGDVTLNNNIAAGSGAVSITSTGGAIPRSAGTITGGNVTLDSATGVGTAAARVFTAATTLAARSTVSGGVFVDELNAVTVNTLAGVANGTAANGDYDLQAGGSITVSGAINTNGTGNTAVRALPAGANVAIGANIGNTTNTQTTVYAGAAITRTAGTVSGQSVVLDGGTGVGATAAANRVATAAGTLAARTRLANGSIFVTEADAVTLDTIGGVANGTAANGNGGYTLGAAGNITVQGAVTTGDNTGAGSGARATGSISLTSTGGSIAVNNMLTTGAVATDDAAGNTTATSGAIVLAASSGSVSGGAALTTGNAELRGAAAAGTDSATSGAITVTAGSGGITLGALASGSATRSGAGVDTDSAVSGAITLNAPGAGGGTVTLGGAINTGATANAAANTSGNVALTSGGANVIVNGTIATGNAAATDIAGNQTARSGNVTLTGVGAAVNAAIGTGSASLGGAAAAGTDSATSGLIQITGGTGGVTVSGPLSTGAATRSGAGVNTDTTTSGNVTVSTTGATGGAVTIGGAVNTGNASGGGTGTNASGNVAVTSGGNNVVTNAAIATGNASAADAGGSEIARSGSVTLTGVGVATNAALATGTANLGGAAGAGTDSATSGLIQITGGTGGATVSGPLSTGTATRSGAGVDTDTATSGNVTVTTAATGGTVTIGSTVLTGAASSAAANTSGSVVVTSSAGSVVTNASVATGGATASDAAANQTARSGSVTFTGTGVLINAAIATGNADLGGAAGAGTDSATSGLVLVTGGTGGVTANGPLSTGTATRSGAGVNTDTTTSGNVTVTTPGATGGAVAIGGAVNTGDVSGGGTGTNASGNVAITSGGNAITLNGSLATGNAAAADAGANEIARSGTVTMTAATSISGTGGATTGSATLAGAAGAGTDSAASGGITITAGSGGASGAIALGGVLTTGNAARTGAVQDTVTSGTITLTSRDGISGAAAPTPLAVLIGTPTGGAANNRGVVRSITSQPGGSIYVTSAGTLIVGDTDTAAGSAQTVSFATTGGADLTVVNNGETLAGDNVLLDSGTGTLTISDTAYNVGAGSLTLTGDEINLTGGANSIRGTGTVTLQPSTAAQGINVGGADSGLPTRLDLTAADILALQNGFANIVIGAAAGTGQMDVRATTFNDNLTLRTPGAGSGGITVSGALNALTNNVALVSAGPVTQTAAITANGLALTGGGAYTLTNGANNVTTLAADAASVAYTDSNALTVGTVGTTNGITTSGGAVQVTSAGANPLTVSQAIVSNGGTVTLASGATGSVALNAGVASGGGDVVVNGGTGGLTQSVASTVDAGGGTITVDANDGAINFAGTLSSASASAAAVALRDAAAATLGNISAPSGTIVLGQAGADNLSGNVVQTAGTTLAGGALSVVGGAAVTLGNANDFAGSASVSSAGNATINDVNALTVGPSTVGGTLLATAGGNLTLGGNVTASGAGNAVVLVAGAGAAFLNPGASTITTPAGRWLVYSSGPAANAFGGLASGQQALWNRTYPAAVAETGNRYVFSTQPTVTVTSTDVTKTYGTDATAAVAAAFTTAGFVDASLYGDVFTQDTVANALTGGVTSAGSAATASVAGSPYATVVAYTATTGYTVATSAAGRVFVDGAPLTVTADDATKVYGDTTTFTGTAFTSSALQNGETIGSVTLTSPGAAATAGVAGSPYAITPSGATGGTFDPNNYVITYVDGSLTVTPRPLAVAADNQTKVYGTPDPALTWTAPGLVNGDTLAGALARAPGETVPGGPYAITQGTLANPNYAIAFTDGALTITPAALLVAANNASRRYGDANPAFTATFTGLANGDTAAAIAGLTFSTPATIASNVGTYAITPLGAANPNYAITYANGTLAVTPAPLVVTANDAARRFGQPNPPFSASFTGFRLGQSVADLTGTLDLSSPAVETSLPGIYPIIPSGVSSLNYAVTFVNGELLVSQSAPPVANARDAAVARSETIMAVDGLTGGCAAPLAPGLVNVAMAPGLCVQRPGAR